MNHTNSETCKPIFLFLNQTLDKQAYVSGLSVLTSIPLIHVSIVLVDRYLDMDFDELPQ